MLHRGGFTRWAEFTTAGEVSKQRRCPCHRLSSPGTPGAVPWIGDVAVGDDRSWFDELTVPTGRIGGISQHEIVGGAQAWKVQLQCIDDMRVVVHVIVVADEA